MVGQARQKRLLKSKTITIDEALKAWQNKDLFVDVRTPEEYAQGHVPGATLISLQDLSARIGEIPQDRNVFLICRSGSRSGKATLALMNQQYTNVYNVDGGMSVWKGPVEANK
jgi:rhodanese-related sulfurtransferase